MSDSYSHPWLTYDRDRMFRDVWLPILMPAQDFTAMSIPLLQDLYPEVYRYGPHVQAWLAWTEAFGELLRTVDDDIDSARRNGEAGALLMQTYGRDSEIGKAISGSLHAPGIAPAPRYMSSVFADIEWTHDVWYLDRNNEMARYSWQVYEMTGAVASSGEVLGALTTAAAVILLQYLPVDPAAPHTRARVLELHNWFSETYGLPQIATTDNPR